MNVSHFPPQKEWPVWEQETILEGFYNVPISFVHVHFAEKTKQLLFRGAQAYMENACVGSTAEESRTVQCPEPLDDRLHGCSRHRCNGQMLIGQDGKLHQPSPSEPGKWD